MYELFQNRIRRYIIARGRKKMARTKKSVSYDQQVEQQQTSLTYQKSNSLINAKGKSSALGLKLFAIGIRRIEQAPDGTLVSHISGQELRELFHRKNGSFYTQIKELIKPTDETKASLLDWRMYIENKEEGRIRGINVITEASFEEGELTLKFNSAIKKDIYGLKGNYGSLNLFSTIMMGSTYSIRFYEIFKSYMDLERARTKSEGPYVVVYELDELKRTLGIINPAGGKDKKAEQFANFSSFRTNVLEKPKKELNSLSEYTGLHVEYESIHSGRGAKVVGIRFILTRICGNNKTKVIETNAGISETQFNVISEMNELMTDENVPLIDIKAICEAAQYKSDKIKSAYELEKHAKNVQNFTAWMIAAIKNDYQQNNEEVKKGKKEKTGKRKDKFNSFKQNKYDFDELERKLIENQ